MLAIVLCFLLYGVSAGLMLGLFAAFRLRSPGVILWTMAGSAIGINFSAAGSFFLFRKLYGNVSGLSIEAIAFFTFGLIPASIAGAIFGGEVGAILFGRHQDRDRP